jgi:NAD(P)-dependent dehydrogenase (short-subunit alcohol dehydrogenase family)
MPTVANLASMSSFAKHVLITGANKGIGLATVRALLEAHDDAFVFLGSRNAARGAAARDSLVADRAAWTDRIAVVELDVSQDASVTAAFDAVAAKVGRESGALYAVVNNAGVGLASGDLVDVLNVNTRGPRRVCEAFLPLLDATAGRIVNVSSASGPAFLANCASERQAFLINPNVTWEQVDALMVECLDIEAAGGAFAEAGLGNGSAYGLSKACLNAYTISLARRHPSLTINACTPGFIETDLTRPYAEGAGKTPQEMGMKSPAEATKALLHLLFGEPGGSGWFFGSDAQRSPLDRYRSPGDPPYKGQ